MKPRRVSAIDPAASLRFNAAQILATRLEELNDLAAQALEPSGETAQHEMRIAAKRLRYILEISAPCLGPEAEALRLVARRLQGVLGEIHDCDVMAPRIAGIASVEARLRTRREQLFAQFRELLLAEESQGALEGAFLESELRKARGRA